MTLKEHHLACQNELLVKALQQAIDFLKLMPRAPITQAKIVQLEQKLNLPLGQYQLEQPTAWKMERVTPAGESLCVSVVNGEIRFETGTLLARGSKVPFALGVHDIDALIAALASQRESLSTPESSETDAS